MSSSWGGRRFSRMSLEYWFTNSPGDLYYSAVEKIAAAMPATKNEKTDTSINLPFMRKNRSHKIAEIIRTCDKINGIEESKNYVDWAREKGFSEKHIKAVLGGRY